MSASWTEHHHGDGDGDDFFYEPSDFGGGGDEESLHDADDDGEDVKNLKIPVEATNSKVSASLISQGVVVDHVWL